MDDAKAWQRRFLVEMTTPQAYLIENAPRTSELARRSVLCAQWTMGRAGGAERRRKGRLRLPRVVRVRPSEPRSADFDEILPTQNAARDGVYFVSKNQKYRQGMRVFITYPYSDAPGSINRESLGEVVRVDKLDHGRYGIAVQIGMPIYLGGKETLR